MGRTYPWTIRCARGQRRRCESLLRALRDGHEPAVLLDSLRRLVDERIVRFGPALGECVRLGFAACATNLAAPDARTFLCELAAGVHYASRDRRRGRLDALRRACLVRADVPARVQALLASELDAIDASRPSDEMRYFLLRALALDGYALARLLTEPAENVIVYGGAAHLRVLAKHLRSSGWRPGHSADEAYLSDGANLVFTQTLWRTGGGEGARFVMLLGEHHGATAMDFVARILAYVREKQSRVPTPSFAFYVEKHVDGDEGRRPASRDLPTRLTCSLGTPLHRIRCDPRVTTVPFDSRHRDMGCVRYELCAAFPDDATYRRAVGAYVDACTETFRGISLEQPIARTRRGARPVAMRSASGTLSVARPN